MCSLNECRFPTFDFMVCIPDEDSNDFTKQVMSDIVDEDKETIEYLQSISADDDAQMFKDMAWESDHLTPMY